MLVGAFQVGTRLATPLPTNDWPRGVKLGIRRAVMTLLVIATAVLAALSPSVAAGADEPVVTAGSAIVVDAVTGEVLYALDADRQLPPASLTKLFTAFLAIEEAQPEMQMSVVPYDLVGEASMGLGAGDTVPFTTLLYGMLLPSGNDAAMTIARNLGGGSVEAFVERVNARSAALGLSGTHLANPHGLDAQQHYSTARDIATLTLLAMSQPQFAAAIGSTSFEANGYSLHQTNQLQTTYPGLLGGKTGVTDAAGNCLMEIAERDGRRVLVVLLGSTPDAWYADAEALLDYGFATLATPGRLPMFDHIGASVTRTVGDFLTVTPIGQLDLTAAQPVTVTASPTAPNPRREEWFWPITAGLAMALALFGVVQAERLEGRLGSRRSRAVGPAPAAVDIGVTYRIPADETISLPSHMRAAVESRPIEQSEFTAELPILHTRIRTHHRDTVRKAAGPAFGFSSD
jgi:D-alanyl-D-alanine carboxypeptidase (penicillin-binding protein 5/6)